MTASISIATSKPRSKRTAKGIILSGADGKHARHDGRHPEHVDQTESMNRRPILDISDAIMESLEGGLFTPTVTMRRTQSRAPRRSVYTSESPGFVCPSPTKRRRIRSTARQTRVATSNTGELPQFDEAGRPIVYVSDGDAWSLRVRR